MKPEEQLPPEHGLNTAFASTYPSFNELLIEDSDIVEKIIKLNELDNPEQLLFMWTAMHHFANILGSGSEEEHASAYRAACFAIETAGLALPKSFEFILLNYMKELSKSSDPQAQLASDFQIYLESRKDVDKIIDLFSQLVDSADGTTLHVTEPMLGIIFMLIERGIAENFYKNAIKRLLDQDE